MKKSDSITFTLEFVEDKSDAHEFSHADADDMGHLIEMLAAMNYLDSVVGINKENNVHAFLHDVSDETSIVVVDVDDERRGFVRFFFNQGETNDRNHG